MLTRSASRRAVQLAVLGSLALTVSACNTAQRLANAGDPPLSQIEDPLAKHNYKPVSMPMPTPQPGVRNPNSLWRNGARAFFKDQRASQVGDILTVVVAIAGEGGVLEGDNVRNRGPNNETMNVPNWFNPLEKKGIALAADTLKSASANVNNATVHRGGNQGASDVVNMRLSAIVLQILPNGNMVINGKQQVKVSTEMRELTITGVIRPEDIDSTNAISADRIGEARISYGGQGYVSDVQKPRIGDELMDILSPF
ncbi:MAG: flagellar basal body L-ring protein FlgH [Rhodospirillaceae bacterium]